MLAFFRNIAIAMDAQPDQQNTAYRAGLLTALQDMGLVRPFVLWCRLCGYHDILDTFVFPSVKHR